VDLYDETFRPIVDAVLEGYNGRCILRGTMRGTIVGVLRGTMVGVLRGTMVGVLRGTMVGVLRGTVVGVLRGTMVGVLRGTMYRAADLGLCFTGCVPLHFLFVLQGRVQKVVHVHVHAYFPVLDEYIW